MLRRNVIANYLGQGWRALMNLAFIPVYIDYLGMDAYGLIGVFAMLQGTLGLIENGLNPTLSREMARFTGGQHTTQSIRDLLRSVEILVFVLSAATALGVWRASGWLASQWLRSDVIPMQEVAQALAIMGVVIGLRFIENVYSSSILGLQRQVVQNSITSIAATLRGVGAVFVLAFVSPSIEAFFLWQGIVSIATVAFLARVVYQVLPPPPKPARFSIQSLRQIGSFATGMVALTFLSVILTKLDKVVLSSVLDLETFGLYALAAAAAAGLLMAAGPLTNAFYPLFTKLMSEDDAPALDRAYHLGAQLISVLMGAAGIVLIVYGDRVLFAWIGDASVARHSGQLLSVLAVGVLFGGLVVMPYNLQLAAGWTSMRVRIDAISAVILVPAILLTVPRYGALGVAWVLAVSSALRLVANVALMHRRLLPAQGLRWLLKDVSYPLSAGILCALSLRWLIPRSPSRMTEAIWLAVVGLCVLLCAGLCASTVRARACGRIRRHLGPGEDPNA